MSNNLCRSILEYQNQAKRLFKTLSDNSPQRCSIETGNGQYIFQWVYLLTVILELTQMLKTILQVPRFHFIYNLQLHYRAAVVLPHLDGDALQQKDCLCLPWWSGTGGVQVFFTALAQLFRAIYIPRASFTSIQIAEFCSQEFHNQYGHKINTATRPYSFIEFDTYIQVVGKSIWSWRKSTWWLP